MAGRKNFWEDASSKHSVQTKNTLGLGTLLRLVALACVCFATTFGIAVRGADNSPMTIKRISADSNKQLIVEFVPRGGTFPSVPHILDLPGPNHRVIFDFIDAAVDKISLGSPEETVTSMQQTLPAVKGLRYSNISNTEKPTARIVIDLPENLNAQPRVVKVEESHITITLGDEVTKAVVVPGKAAPQLAENSSQSEAVEGSSSYVPLRTSANGGAISPSETFSQNPAGNVASQTTNISSLPSGLSEPQNKEQTSSPERTKEPAQNTISDTGSAQPASESATKPVAQTGGWDWTSAFQSASTEQKAEIKPGAAQSLPVIPQSSSPAVDVTAKQSVSSGASPLSLQPSSSSFTSSDTNTTLSVSPGTPQLVPGVSSPETTLADTPSTTASSQQAPSPALSSAPADTTPANSQLAPLPSLPAGDVSVAPANSQLAPLPSSGSAAADAGTKTPVSSQLAPLTSSDTGVASVTTTTDSAAQSAVSSASTPASQDSATNAKEAVKHYNEAVKAHLSGKLPDAVKEYQSALAFNPGLAEAHSNLGLIHNQQHNYATALSEFRKALAIDPKDAITYNGIGATLRAERDIMGAIKNWQTAVSLDPRLATAHYNLGTAYEIQKEYDKALEAYELAVKNDYRLGEAYYRMGLILERKRRFNEAAQQFKEALKVSPSSEYSEDARQRLAFLTKQKQQ